jgi:hypothetical protein
MIVSHKLLFAIFELSGLVHNLVKCLYLMGKLYRDFEIATELYEGAKFQSLVLSRYLVKGEGLLSRRTRT